MVNILNPPGYSSIELKRHEITNKKKGETPWPVYDSPFFDWETGYQKPLQDVLPEEGIKRFLSNLLREKKQKLNALEIAGTGRGLLELKPFGVGNITAITLNDFRNVGTKFVDIFKSLKVIEGAIEEKGTIEKTKKLFDLVVCVPRAACVLNPDMINLDVLSQIYNVLTSDGLYMTQLPPKLIKELGTDWIKALSKTPGLEVKYGENVGMLYSAFGRTDTRYLPALSIRKLGNPPLNIDFIKNIQHNALNRASYIRSKI